MKRRRSGDEEMKKEGVVQSEGDMRRSERIKEKVERSKEMRE